MKKLFLQFIIAFCIFTLAIPSWANTEYGTTGGGNWNAAGSWSATSNCTSSCGGAAPVAGDTVILDSHSGNITLTANASCTVLNMSGYAGTLAMGIYVLNVAGNLTLGGAITASSVGGINIAASSTITSNSVNIPYLSFVGSGTYTLADNLAVTNTLTYTAVTPVMSGAHDISCATLKIGSTASTASTLTLVAGRNLTVSTAIAIATVGFGTTVIQSSSASDTTITYNGTAANSKIAGATFTHVVGAGTGAPLYNWFGSGSNTGIQNVTNTDIGGTSGPRWGF